MSTVDPRAARAEQEARAGGSRLLITIIIAVVHLALWAMAGFGFPDIADRLRLMSMNQVKGWESALSAGPALFFIGIFAGAFLGVLFTMRVSRGHGIGPGMLAPIATGTLGLAIGLTLAIPRWTPPEVVGEKLPFLDGTPEPWGFDAWLAYNQPYILPAVFGVIAIISLFLGIRAVARTRAKQRSISDLASSGTKVAGVVTEVLPTGAMVNGLPYVKYTVKFTDHIGADRWLQKKGAFPYTQAPRQGDSVVVWFDQSDPGNQKRIVVGLGPEAEEALKER